LDSSSSKCTLADLPKSNLSIQETLPLQSLNQDLQQLKTSQVLDVTQRIRLSIYEICRHDSNKESISEKEEKSECCQERKSLQLIHLTIPLPRFVFKLPTSDLQSFSLEIPEICFLWQDSLRQLPQSKHCQCSFSFTSSPMPINTTKDPKFEASPSRKPTWMSSD
jgi:hypothetical protein